MLNLINQSTYWPLETVNQGVSHDTVIVEKWFFTQRGPDRQSERTKQAVRGDQTGGQRGPDRRSERTRQAVREDQTGGLRGPERWSERTRQAVREDQTGSQRGPDRRSEGIRQVFRDVADRVFSAFHLWVYLFISGENVLFLLQSLLSLLKLLPFYLFF
ncbi:unnamed protein product [Arctogadus glacialis]